MATTSGGNVPQPLAHFGFIAGPRIGEEIPVGAPVATIGRASRCDVVLDDDSVSDTHARLEYEDGYWRLTDLDSTNGTFVEGVRLAPQVPTPLSFGYTVRVGAMRMQFREVDGADPEAAQAGWTPPEEPARVAERKPGFRLPVWVLLVVLLVVAAIVFFLMGGLALFEAGAPEAAPAAVAWILPATGP